jgi:hypothetical protein
MTPMFVFMMDGTYVWQLPMFGTFACVTDGTCVTGDGATDEHGLGGGSQNSDFEDQRSNLREQGSDFKAQISRLRFQGSDFKAQISNFEGCGSHRRIAVAKIAKSSGGSETRG